MCRSCASRSRLGDGRKVPAIVDGAMEDEDASCLVSGIVLDKGWGYWAVWMIWAVVWDPVEPEDNALLLNSELRDRA